MESQGKKSTNIFEISSLEIHQFEGIKFVNKDAAKTFERDVLVKPFITERGILFNEFPFQKYFRDFGWDNLAKHPNCARNALVREFYANATHCNIREGKVKVRGKMVSFCKNDINDYYGIPHVPVDEFYEICSDAIDFAQIVKAICMSGVEWIPRNGNVANLQEKDLTMPCRALHWFISSRIMPSRRVAGVSVENAVLIYCIKKGKAVNIGRIIYEEICQALEKDCVAGFICPQLISNLCIQAGVPWEVDDDKTFPNEVISQALMKKPLVQSFESIKHDPSVSDILEVRFNRLEEKIDRICGLISQMARNNEFDVEKYASLPSTRPPPPYEDC